MCPLKLHDNSRLQRCQVVYIYSNASLPFYLYTRKLTLTPQVFRLPDILYNFTQGYPLEFGRNGQQPGIGSDPNICQDHLPWNKKFPVTGYPVQFYTWISVEIWPERNQISSILPGTGYSILYKRVSVGPDRTRIIQQPDIRSKLIFAQISSLTPHV